MKKLLVFIAGLWLSASIAAQVLNVGDSTVVNSDKLREIAEVVQLPSHTTVNLFNSEKIGLEMFADEDLHIYDFYLSDKMTKTMYLEHLIIGLLRIKQLENNLPVNWWMIEKQAQQITRNFLN